MQVEAGLGTSQNIPIEVTDRLSHARTLIQAYWPFLTAAAFRLIPRWSRELPTLAVDRHWRLYLNPEFVAKLRPVELALLIAGHELQHALLGHCNRCIDYRDVYLVDQNGRRINVANVAHDLAINSSLEAFAKCGVEYRRQIGKSSGRVKLDKPTDALYPEQFKQKDGKPFPEGLISEEYARLLVETYPPQSGGGGCQMGTAGPKTPGAGSGQCGSGGGSPPGEWEDRSGASLDDHDSGVTEQEQNVLRQATAEAVRKQASSHRGTIPGNMELWADTFLEPPRVNWEQELRRIIRSGVNWAQGRVDYSFAKPHRRSVALQSRIILPGMYAPKPQFAVILDSSGSMDKSDYQASFSEIQGIIKGGGMPKVPVLVVDAAVQSVKWISHIDELDLKGGGGTDMPTGIAAGMALGLRLLIVCTDGVTPWGEPPPPDVRVIIVLTRPEIDSYPTPDWAQVVYAFDPE